MVPKYRGQKIACCYFSEEGRIFLFSIFDWWPLEMIFFLLRKKLTRGNAKVTMSQFQNRSQDDEFCLHSILIYFVNQTSQGSVMMRMPLVGIRDTFCQKCKQIWREIQTCKNTLKRHLSVGNCPIKPKIAAGGETCQKLRFTGCSNDCAFPLKNNLTSRNTL